MQIVGDKLDKFFFIIDNCALPGFYAACIGNSLPTFQDNLSVPSKRVKNPKVYISLCFRL